MPDTPAETMPGTPEPTKGDEDPLAGVTDEEFGQAVMEASMSEDAGVTTDVESILMGGDGTVTWNVPTGMTDKSGVPIKLAVKVSDPNDPGLLATYSIQQGKDEKMATLELWKACVVEPASILEPATFARLPLPFKESLTSRLLHLVGYESFFEKLRLVSRREMLQAARKLSTRSPAPTASTPKR